MTMQEASQGLKKLLQEIYDPRESANIAEWIMEDITGLYHVDRIIHHHQLLTPEQEETFDLYSKRLAEGMPVQYVTGYGWFMGSRFRVNENVLIPRPETEELVQWAIDDIVRSHKNTGTITILDIGSGSGCIPIILKKKIPGAEVHSIDISPDALDVARNNAKDLQADIIFHQGNFLIPGTWDDLPAADLIISNPPYIPLRDKDTLNRNVIAFEPHLAIFVENADPLVFYKAIAGFANTKLKEGGAIYVEIDDGQSGALTKLMKKSGFGVDLRKDMQERYRLMKLDRVI